jgi:hypothetical protein
MLIDRKLKPLALTVAGTVLCDQAGQLLERGRRLTLVVRSGSAAASRPSSHRSPAASSRRDGARSCREAGRHRVMRKPATTTSAIAPSAQ